MKIVVEFGQTIENVEEKRMVVTYHHYYIQGLSLYDVTNFSLFDLYIHDYITSLGFCKIYRYFALSSIPIWVKISL